MNSQVFWFFVFFIRKMCMFKFLAGQYFAKFNSKQRVTGQCQGRSYKLQHLSNFLKKNIIYNFMATASVRTVSLS